MDQQPAAALPSELMAKPVLSWQEFWGSILGIPDSTAEQLAREPAAPKFFTLGRRRYIRTVDARAWIDQRAQAVPYTPRRNRCQPAGMEQ